MAGVPVYSFVIRLSFVQSSGCQHQSVWVSCLLIFHSFFFRSVFRLSAPEWVGFLCAHFSFFFLLFSLQVVSTRVGGVPEVLPSDMIKMAEPSVKGNNNCNNIILQYSSMLIGDT